jgi:ABC-type phosphate/phosphonate transport system substrate-binding protein
MALIALIAFPGTGLGRDQTPKKKTLTIGMVRTLFRGQPEPLVRALMEPFGALLESQSGFRGDLVTAAEGADLAQMMAEGKCQVGVFHGIEFGWAQARHPDLRPLMIAVNQDSRLYACLVVRRDSRVTSFADLKGKKVAMPRLNHIHCQLFLEKRCADLGFTNPDRFLAEITRPGDPEAALDDVRDGKVPAAIVEDVALASYQRRKPERYRDLRLAVRSEAFPACVIAYRAGTLDEATLKQFRAGLFRANQLPLGKKLLALWNLTAFKEVPADYPKMLADILKTYPPPPARTPAHTTSADQSTSER